MKIKLVNLLSKVFLVYLKLVAITGKLEVRYKDKIRENIIVGYWHGDSYCMQLVLRQISKKFKKINAIITADERGDVIEKIITHYGASALRLPDGLKMRHFLRELKETSIYFDGIIVAALDGPKGPLHEPKKLLFLLAANADKEMVYIHFKYTHVIRLKHRWDQYVIPLPFTRIIAEVEELGYISKEHLRNFTNYKKRLKY